MPVSHSLPSREAAAFAAAASAAAFVAAALRAAGSLSTRLPEGGTCDAQRGWQAARVKRRSGLPSVRDEQPAWHACRS